MLEISVLKKKHNPKTDASLISNWTQGELTGGIFGVCQIQTHTCIKPKAKSASLLSNRTKWKRQTAVGLELLAEAGNYSALQRMFPSPYFYPQSLVSNLDPGAALYLYRGPSAPPPSLQRPLVPRILLHGLQGGGEPPLPPMSGVLSRPAQQRWAGPCWLSFLFFFFFFLFCFCTPSSAGLLRRNETKTDTNKKGTSRRKGKCPRPSWCEIADWGWTLDGALWLELTAWEEFSPFFLGHELYL